MDIIVNGVREGDFGLIYDIGGLLKKEISEL